MQSAQTHHCFSHPTDPDDELTYTAYFARFLSEKLKDKNVVRYDGYYKFDKEKGFVHMSEYRGPVTVSDGTNGKITIVRSGISGRKQSGGLFSPTRACRCGAS